MDAANQRELGKTSGTCGPPLTCLVLFGDRAGSLYGQVLQLILIPLDVVLHPVVVWVDGEYRVRRLYCQVKVAHTICCEPKMVVEV